MWQCASTQPGVSSRPCASMTFAPTGTSICEALLENGVNIEHACDMSRACTTCHVIVRQGFDSMEPSEEEEDDLLDKAWGLEPNSRLSCQAVVNDMPLVVEIPRYSINMAKEGKR